MEENFQEEITDNIKMSLLTSLARLGMPTSLAGLCLLELGISLLLVEWGKDFMIENMEILKQDIEETPQELLEQDSLTIRQIWQEFGPEGEKGALIH